MVMQVALLIMDDLKRFAKIYNNFIHSSKEVSSLAIALNTESSQLVRRRERE